MIAAAPGQSLLLEYLKPWKGVFWRATLMSWIAGLLVLAPSYYMLEVYDRVVQSRSHMTLLMLTIAVLLAYAAMEFLEYLRNELLREVGHAVDQKMSPRLFTLIFEASLRKNLGGSVQVLNDWRLIRDFLHSPFVLAAMECPVAAIFLLIVFSINPLLGWLTFVGAIVQVGIAWLTERSTQKPLAEANRSAIAAQRYADGSLRNAEIIEAMGMLPHIHRRWLKLQGQFLAMQSEASLAAGGFQAGSRMVQQILGSALLGLGAWLTLKGKLDGGGALMVVASIIGARVLSPLVQMVAQWRQVVSAREAWARLEHLLGTFPVKPPAMALPAPRGVLTIEQLVAGPPTVPGQQPIAILRGIQLSLLPGEMLAVIGPSAAGKTTLARLLVGLWPAISGKVRLDGADIYTWDKNELGPHIGYLPQGVELFEGTIAENISRFDVRLQTGTGPQKDSKNPVQILVEKAAGAVGLHEFILSLPQGYDTPVGPDGARLSGGQRQRVALARALYGEPSLVVLDEPNSSLDEAGDAALAAALRDLKARGASVIVMTHRTSVLAIADKVLMIRDGLQQAFGPRDEVLAALQQANQANQANQATQASPATQTTRNP